MLDRALGLIIPTLSVQAGGRLWRGWFVGCGGGGGEGEERLKMKSRLSHTLILLPNLKQFLEVGFRQHGPLS